MATIARLFERPLPGAAIFGGSLINAYSIKPPGAATVAAGIWLLLLTVLWPALACAAGAEVGTLGAKQATSGEKEAMTGAKQAMTGAKQATSGAEPAAPVKLHYDIIAEQPHDSDTFTQGLIIDGGALVETSGLYGQSFLTRYPIAGEGPVQRLPLPADVFAEGLARVGDVYWVLTWQERRALRFSVDTLAPLPAANYAGEGWGLTYDGRQLIMSDGSDHLIFRDADSFAPLRRVAVRAAGRPVTRLNELEFAHGKVWANVWYAPLIVVIDPNNGAVVGELDLTPLVRRHTARQREAVLNGIAYDAASDSFWVTGKLWPKRYQLRVTWPAPAAEAAL